MRLAANDQSFFPQRFTTISGVEVEIPRFTLRKDEQVRHVFMEVLSRNELGVSAFLMGDGLTRLVALSASDTVADFTTITSMILDRDRDWVEDNCDSADMLELVGSMLLEPTSNTDVGRVQRGNVWTLARIIDWCASEYSWTVDNVLGLTRWELRAVMQAAKERIDDINRARKGKRPRSGRGSSDPESFVQPARRKNPTGESYGGEEALAFARHHGMYKGKQKGGVAS